MDIPGPVSLPCEAHDQLSAWGWERFYKNKNDEDTARDESWWSGGEEEEKHEGHVCRDREEEGEWETEAPKLEMRRMRRGNVF